MIARMRQRRDTAAGWMAANPTLGNGEFGYETDTGKLKVGDGSTAWASLAYWTGGSAVAAHKTSHATGGSDAIAAADIGATPASHAALTTTAHGGIVASSDSRLTDSRTPTAHAASHATGQSDAIAAADIGAYRTQTPATASNISGSVALAFASSLTLQHTLTGNVTALTEPTGLADGETGEAIVEKAGFTLPANPAAGQRWNEDAWTVTGTYVRIVVERVGSYYYWTAESLEVAT